MQTRSVLLSRFLVDDRYPVIVAMSCWIDEIDYDLGKIDLSRMNEIRLTVRPIIPLPVPYDGTYVVMKCSLG
jgi:hypothetical protein